jgi:hypothetical protein
MVKCESCGYVHDRLEDCPESDARAELDAALDKYEAVIEEWVRAEATPEEFAADDRHDAARAAVLDAVEQLCSGLYEGVHPLEDGDEVQYVGVYVLKWGKVDTPEIGFRLVDARRLVRGKDGDGARR